MTLSYLSNVDLSELLRHSKDVERELIKQNYEATTLSDLAIVSGFGYVLGYSLAFIITLLISKRQKFYWLNSIISLVIFWTLGQFDFTGWYYLKNIFLTPGEVTNGVWYYVINGFLMVAVGIAILFVANKTITTARKTINVKPSLA